MESGEIRVSDFQESTDDVVSALINIAASQKGHAFLEALRAKGDMVITVGLGGKNIGGHAGVLGDNQIFINPDDIENLSYLDSDGALHAVELERIIIHEFTHDYFHAFHQTPSGNFTDGVIKFTNFTLDQVPGISERASYNPQTLYVSEKGDVTLYLKKGTLPFILSLRDLIVPSP